MAAVWLSGLKVSSVASHQLGQPNLHLWALNLEGPSPVETLQRPGPGSDRKQFVSGAGTVLFSFNTLSHVSFPVTHNGTDASIKCFLWC